MDIRNTGKPFKDGERWLSCKKASPEKFRELPTAVQLHRFGKIPLIALRAPKLSLHPCAWGERGACGVGVWWHVQPLLFKVGKGCVGVRSTEKHLEFLLQWAERFGLSLLLIFGKLGWAKHFCGMRQKAVSLSSEKPWELIRTTSFIAKC